MNEINSMLDTMFGPRKAQKFMMNEMVYELVNASDQIMAM